jgi:hypothetical protein
MNSSYLLALTELKVHFYLLHFFFGIAFIVPQKFVLLCSVNLQSLVRKGQLTEEDYEKKLSLLCGALDYEQFRDTDVVIEVDPVSIIFTTL